MPAARSSTSSSSRKPSAPAVGASAGKTRAPAKAKPATQSAIERGGRSGASRKKSAISSEQRDHYVKIAAYYIAERRGFAVGNPLQDWTQAEAEIDRLLAAGHFCS